MTTPTLWWIALMASTIVVVVLAVLLALVAAAARSVDRHSAAIKTTGEEIAGNTAPIRMLERATEELREIQAGLGRLEQAARRLEATIAARGRGKP
jgi:cytochrome oxidase Cu insertion factor (SCO1/SenC/PrrC family)